MIQEKVPIEASSARLIRSWIHGAAKDAWSNSFLEARPETGSKGPAFLPSFLLITQVFFPVGR
jgi:hypothetical protein